MTNSAQKAVIFLLCIQAEHAVLSYNKQIVEQMFAYYDETDSFHLMSIL